MNTISSYNDVSGIFPVLGIVILIIGVILFGIGLYKLYLFTHLQTSSDQDEVDIKSFAFGCLCLIVGLNALGSEKTAYEGKPASYVIETEAESPEVESSEVESSEVESLEVESSEVESSEVESSEVEPETQAFNLLMPDKMVVSLPYFENADIVDLLADKIGFNDTDGNYVEFTDSNISVDSNSKEIGSYFLDKDISPNDVATIKLADGNVAYCGLCKVEDSTDVYALQSVGASSFVSIWVCYYGTETNPEVIMDKYLIK